MWKKIKISKIVATIASIATIFAVIVGRLDKCNKGNGPIPPPKIIYFEAEPNPVQNGRASKLFWKAEYAENCIIKSLDGKLKVPHRSEVDNLFVSPTRTTRYALVCFNANHQSAKKERSLLVETRPPDSHGIPYFPIMSTQKALDCDTGFKNDHKAIKLEELKGRRVKMEKRIREFAAEDSKIIIDPAEVATYGTIPGGGDALVNVSIGFNEPPIAIMRDKRIFAGNMAIGDNVLFDCAIGDYCKDGLMDGGIVFDDCVIARPKK